MMLASGGRGEVSFDSFTKDVEEGKDSRQELSSHISMKLDELGASGKG